MFALLCGGQGRLTPQSLDLGANSSKNSDLLHAAGVLLGHDPLKFLRESDPQTRSSNYYNQFFSVLTALCHYNLIKDHLPERICVAGYSVGEVAAFAIANIWQPSEALAITLKRATLMDSAHAIKARLAFVMGLSEAQLQTPLHQANCVIAIHNPDNFFILAGNENDIEKLCGDLRNIGATRCDVLDVFIPSHTPFLANAVQPFYDFIAAKPFNAMDDNRLLFSGLDGGRIFKVQDGLKKLAEEIAQRLDWQAVLQALSEQGVTSILDLGPGNALANMIKSYYPAMSAYAVGDFQTIDGIETWLKRQE